MAVLVPLNSAEALPRLAEAGVDEIYVGFHDEVWEERFGGAELNRMSGFGREANPFDFDQMCEQLKMARNLGIRGFVCFNSSAYSRAQAEFIASAYLPRLAKSGASGIILSSQALVENARDAGLGAVMSTVAGAFNERLVAYYRNCGATRVILPRDLSSDEIACIVAADPDMEYEVFLMRNGCMFSDSHCLGCHRSGKPSLCRSLRTGDYGTWSVEGSDEAGGAGEADENLIERTRHTEWLLNTYYHLRTCGLCALWRFEQLGIAAYKVVGRGDDADDLVADAGLVARNAALARTCATEEEYLERMELPREPETLCGYNGLSCYYPELARTLR